MHMGMARKTNLNSYMLWLSYIFLDPDTQRHMQTNREYH